MVRTRFAPSPTGQLHVGNARLAVLNWLFARKHGGAFVLRIEDTDEERTAAGSEAQILDDLAWLGLAWDEGPDRGGPHAPYRQSERLSLYHDHARRLADAGLAYPCYCTPEELEERRQAALARGEPPHYDGTCRRLTREDAARLEREGRRAALRFRVQEDGDVAFHDVIRGDVRVHASDIGDFIVLRADGLPTYNFAVVVDDARMEITHVIRGVGHLSNTPRQVLLFEAFGYALPVFAHVPQVLGPDRQKLSKRHGAKPVAEYRREGYHPDALANYLSLLAWSSPTGEEVLGREQLVDEVSLERIGSADVVFDPVKLHWLSAKHIEAMPLGELVEAVSAHLDRERFPIPDEALPVAVKAVRSHLGAFSEINEQAAPFTGMLDAAGIAARDALRGDEAAQAVLRAAIEALAAVPEPWRAEELAAALKAIGAEAGARGRALYQPLRVALTGAEHGPPLVAVLEVVGRAATLRLLREAV